MHFKMGARSCFSGRLKSDASGLRPKEGLRPPILVPSGRCRATVGAKRLKRPSSLGQCAIGQFPPKLKRALQREEVDSSGFREVHSPSGDDKKSDPHEFQRSYIILQTYVLITRNC